MYFYNSCALPADLIVSRHQVQTKTGKNGSRTVAVLGALQFWRLWKLRGQTCNDILTLVTGLQKLKAGWYWEWM